jgi:hypothetical protein
LSRRKARVRIGRHDDRREGDTVSDTVSDSDKVKKLREHGLIKDPLPPGWDENKLEEGLKDLTDNEIDDLIELAKKFRGKVKEPLINCFIPL